MMHRLLLTGLCAALALASGSALAQPAFDEGDALVLDLTGNSIIGVKLSPPHPVEEEGDQFPVPSGGPVIYPRGLAIASQSNGELFVSGNSQVVRVNSEGAGRQDFVQSFSWVTRGITFDELEENLFVVQPDFYPLSAVFGIDRVTGLGGLASEGLVYPRGIVLDPSDPSKLLVVDSQDYLAGDQRGVYRVDPNQFDPLDPLSNLTPIFLAGIFSFPNRLAAMDTGALCDVDPALPDDGLVIYVTDAGIGGETPKVVRLQRDTGAPPDCPYEQKIVAFGGELIRPIGIAIEAGGTLLVADADAQAVIRIDPEAYPDDYDPQNPPETPNQDIISQYGDFDTPWEIHIVPALSPASNANLLVTDTGATAATTGVLRVIPPDSNREDVATGVEFSRPTGAMVDHATGYLVVVDLVKRAVYQVSDGFTNLVAREGFLNVDPPEDETELLPAGVVVEADGSYLVTDPNAGRIIRIHPNDYEPTDPPENQSNQELVSPNPDFPDFDSFFKRPVATEILGDGRLFVADAGDPLVADDGRLIEVNPDSGRQVCRYQLELLEEVTDSVFDRDGTIVFAGGGITPVFRLGTPGFLIESESSEYQSPGGVAIDVNGNRDILVVDAGDPQTPGDGRILQLDPLESEPTVVAGSDGLSDPFGIDIDAVPEAPPAFEEGDQDLDGVSDEDDNCVDVKNADQWNSNPGIDVFGNACDGDFDNNGGVGISDYAIFVSQWEKTAEGDEDFDPDVDMDGNGGIGISDWPLFASQFAQGHPGPAGSRAGIDPQGPCIPPASP